MNKWIKYVIVDITPEEKNVIKQAKKSFLFTGIRMGAFDGAESCDLIGLYLLHLLTTNIENIVVGLYRDDGLCVSNATPRLTEKLRQKIVKIFKDNDLGTTSAANLQQVLTLEWGPLMVQKAAISLASICYTC